MGDRYAIDYYKARGRSRACAEDFWIRKEKFTEAYVKLCAEFPWAVGDLALVALGASPRSRTRTSTSSPC